MILNYVYRWPLIVHLATGCFCLGSSATFHLFEKCSHHSYNTLSKLDYAGISILVMGSSYPPIFYCFACQPVFWVRNLFCILTTICCTTTFVITMHPLSNKPYFRPYRAGMFIALGISAAFPFVYLQNAPASYKPYVLPSWDVMPWLYGGIAYIVGAVIFALRIPERWYPYKFDLLGSSHNIHHVCVVIGLAIHFNDAMRLYIDRKEFVCPIEVPTNFG